MTGRTDKGEVVTVEISAPGSAAANYGFDVTPARYVTGLITERGVSPASREGSSRSIRKRKMADADASWLRQRVIDAALDLTRTGLRRTCRATFPRATAAASSSRRRASPTRTCCPVTSWK